MIDMLRLAPRPLGIRRAAWGLGVALLLVAALGAADAPAQVPAARLATSQRLVALLGSHTARVRPDAQAWAIERVASRRPLTRVRTVLPVLGEAMHGTWLRVRLPGRPNGHTGWVSSARTRAAATEWSIDVDLSARRITIDQRGEAVRRFPAVVGKRSTPTPRGRFFVEEALKLAPSAPGGPYALATSARSNALQEFDGGPGQIAIHGRRHLPGTLGTAASHGCIRLGTRAVTWLARRIGAGTPVTIRR